MKKYKNALKKILARLLFFLIRPFKKKIAFSNKILVITTTGLGDTLWATPAIYKLKLKYPYKKITVLTNELGAQIFENNPYIDKILIWKKPFLLSFFSLLSLRKETFDQIFLFHASQRIVFILLGFLKAKKIIGTKGLNKDMDFLFTSLIEKKHIHEVHRRLEMDQLDKKNLSINFFLSKEEKKEAKNELLSLGVDPHIPLVALHPGAKDRYKCYPITQFCKVAKQLRGPVQFYLSGQEEELDLIEMLKKNVPNSFNLKNLSIRKYAAILSQCDLLISNDTGPMHLACGLDIPIIALFSPTNPKTCGPLSNKAHVFYEKKSCSTCLKRKCLQPFCLLQIPPHAIVQKANALITKSNLRETCNLK